MKREISILGLFSLMVVSVISFVSAQTVEAGVKSVTDGVGTVVRLLFGDFLQSYQAGQDIFYVKILLFILLYVMIQTAVRAVPKLGENRGVVVVVSFIVSVLAIKWMSDGLVQTILLPYGSLGIALATLLPFLIFFYFVHATKMNGLGRRIAWAFFALSFILVFYTRNFKAGATPLPQEGLYFYYAVGILIALALVFDRGIHQYFFMHELNMFYRGAKGKAVAALQAEYLNIVHVDSPEAEKRRKDIEENLKRLGGSLP
jgi:hypothetical protein